MKKTVINQVKFFLLFASILICGIMQAQTSKPTIYAQSGDTSICYGAGITLFVNSVGTAPYSFEWKKNGVFITWATDSVLNIPSATMGDEGTYVCIVSNQDGSDTTQNVRLKVVKVNVNAGLDVSICRGSSTQLNGVASTLTSSLVEFNKFTYEWSPYWDLSNYQIANPVATPYYNTQYILYATNQNGCIGSDTMNVIVNEPFMEEICMVASDSTTGKCIIVWEKTPNKGIKEYKIMRAIGPQKSVFEVVAIVPYDSMSAYLDITSRPDSAVQTYQLVTVDTCNNESAISYPHSTSFLTVNPDATPGIYHLNWMPYMGFYFDTVYIYRSGDSFNFTCIDSISSGEPWYIDSTAGAYINEVYYRLKIIKEDSCVATSAVKASSTTYTTSTSNMEQYRLVGVNDNRSTPLQLFPNPVVDLLNVKGMADGLFYISDATGRRVLEGKNTGKIDVRLLESGIYIISLQTKTGINTGRFVKE